MTQTPEQRTQALQEANRIRFYRATLKAELKQGGVTLHEAIHHQAPEMQRMRVSEVLLSTPNIGRTKVTRILRSCWLSDVSKLGKLNDRQKEALLAYVAQNYPTVEIGVGG